MIHAERAVESACVALNVLDPTFYYVAFGLIGAGMFYIFFRMHGVAADLQAIEKRLDDIFTSQGTILDRISKL